MNKKYIFNVSMIGMLLLFLISCFFIQTRYVNALSVTDAVIRNDSTGIPDRNLYCAILSELEKSKNKTFTEKEAESILDLDCMTRKIKSIKGIEKLKNLKSLKIEESQLKDLRELKNLTKLETFSIKGYAYDGLEIVGELKNLKSLKLINCGLDDGKLKSIIKNLVDLTELDVSNSKVSDLNDFSSFTNLETLYAKNCKIKSLSGIETLTKLKYLNLSSNSISDISGLEKLVDLVELDISNNNIVKLVNLKDLSELSMEYLHFDGNKISKKEFTNNLPPHIEKWWINNQVLMQKTKKKLNVNKVNKIKSVTKQIKGVTEKKAVVILKTNKGKKIKKISANKSGKFVFKNINLKKYKGKKLKIMAYLYYNDRINGESHYKLIGTVRFLVK